MNWYLSKIVFQIICGDGQHTPQFDEQLRLIEAEDADIAFAKAQAIGGQEQEAFLNQHQHLVQWQFVNESVNIICLNRINRNLNTISDKIFMVWF